jgi:hypothetical protein
MGAGVVRTERHRGRHANAGRKERAVSSEISDALKADRGACPRAMAGNARRQRRHSWESRQRSFYKLQILKSPGGPNPTLSANHTSACRLSSPVLTTCLPTDGTLPPGETLHAKPRASATVLGPSAATARPGGLNWAKRSKFAGQRVTFTKPWRERRRSHPGCVRQVRWRPRRWAT